MVCDKIRIKKYQHEKVDQWCEALGIPDRRFVEDAINFYLRYLEGKQPTTLPIIQLQSCELSQETVESIDIDNEDPDEYQGGISL
ncbi:hypothetical protein [Nostoc sp. FACHB-190]|uniref:hypothetical protein n=1 Tax=Nostoc sp. FACHB-190 TaxID=2692838 RepID=UPI00168899CC|nr:hypothetical protein [Nostoc sp. FACHB-190]MBD2303034.1 hypothetical protein [Nostoc sp. FACHB-190]